MSRVGKLPIKLPKDTKLEVVGATIKVVGPKGQLSKELPRNIGVEVKDGLIQVSAKKDDKRTKALHGTYRALIANMVKGVSEGWSKTLELVGAGYRVELSGNTLIINVGFSHPVNIETPDGITFKTEKSLIIMEGMDKELVGQIAATIRAIRPPEPYKGKGIRYKDEEVKRKPGKAAKAQGAPA